ncbi:MAG: hypothetical protein ACRDYX_17400 [Egibacteraceae bacterium]
MICDDDKTVVTRQEPGSESLGEVEALCGEIVAELREVVEMFATYRQTIGDAARLIARAAVSPAVGGPQAGELARELARMAHVEEEVERLLLLGGEG